MTTNKQYVVSPTSPSLACVSCPPLAATRADHKALCQALVGRPDSIGGHHRPPGGAATAAATAQSGCLTRTWVAAVVHWPQPCLRRSVAAAPAGAELQQPECFKPIHLDGAGERLATTTAYLCVRISHGVRWGLLAARAAEDSVRKRRCAFTLTGRREASAPPCQARLIPLSAPPSVAAPATDRGATMPQANGQCVVRRSPAASADLAYQWCNSSMAAQRAWALVE